MLSPENPFAYGHCEVCDSPYKLLMRYVGTARTKRLIPLFYCMECESFTCIGDYVENEGQLSADVEFNVQFVEQKLEGTARLAKFLGDKLYHGSPSQVAHADVGCNIGALVKAFADASYKSVGYDTNRLAIERGRALFPAIDIVATQAGSDGRRFDLITLIDVLEHIKQPFEFFGSIVPSLNTGGHMFVLVPRVDRDSWRFLAEGVSEQMNSRPVTPFRDNDVHVVHYSTKGLARIGEIFGLEVVEDHGGLDWPLYGMLFRKR